ncbi:MAG: thiamine phosphate synthase [PVC group bacterium]|nr:thiamine phosphate synthase [PVC group bacterium]
MQNNLYLVLTSSYRNDLNPVEIAALAIEGGVDVLQMREKQLSREELITLGRQYRTLCHRTGTIYIVNDNPELAVEVDADGVHMGQEDLKAIGIAEIRDIVGKRMIGVSTHSLEQFRIANEEDLDYIAFGPLFETKTKDYSIGLDEVATVLKEAKKPIVFIGGINLDNIDSVLSLGAQNIALISAIMQAQDIKLQAQLFKRKIYETKI